MFTVRQLGSAFLLYGHSENDETITIVILQHLCSNRAIKAPLNLYVFVNINLFYFVNVDRYFYISYNVLQQHAHEEKMFTVALNYVCVGNTMCFLSVMLISDWLIL